MTPAHAAYSALLMQLKSPDQRVQAGSLAAIGRSPATRTAARPRASGAIHDRTRQQSVSWASQYSHATERATMAPCITADASIAAVCRLAAAEKLQPLEEHPLSPVALAHAYGHACVLPHTRRAALSPSHPATLQLCKSPPHTTITPLLALTEKRRGTCPCLSPPTTGRAMALLQKQPLGCAGVRAR